MTVSSAWIVLYLQHQSVERDQSDSCLHGSFYLVIHPERGYASSEVRTAFIVNCDHYKGYQSKFAVINHFLNTLLYDCSI
jgi:hypothetical protein